MSKLSEINFPATVTQDSEVRPFDRDLVTVLTGWTQNLLAIVDGGISLEDNIDAATASFTSSATPDEENIVPHGLGKVPTHFIVTSLDKAAIIYKGTTAFTKTNIYLKSNVASTVVKVVVL